MALRDGRVGTEVALETPLALVSLLVDLEATNRDRQSAWLFTYISCGYVNLIKCFQKVFFEDVSTIQKMELHVRHNILCKSSQN